MKYLEDCKLSELTSELTDAAIGGSRVLNGRVEAFIMKRAGTDKKYAHALGERYVAEMELAESEIAMYQHMMRRHTSDENPGAKEKHRKRSQSVGFNLDEKPPAPPAKQQRSRASSFDSLGASSSGNLPKSALGDFQETGTRRLMTDLILTLNASFPDYDFGDVRPSHFVKVPMESALRRINERLSEFAAQQSEPPFLSKLWASMDSVISLSQSVVYSFAPSERDDDSFLAQTLVGEDSEATALWSFNYFFVNKHKKRILFFSCVETMHKEEPMSEGEDENFVAKGYTTDTYSGDGDFDLDPSADVAGGIPLLTST